MAKKGKGKGRCVLVGLLGLIMLLSVGCASNTRKVSLNDSCLIMNDVTIYVDKRNTTENPNATPDLDLTIPLIPSL